MPADWLSDSCFKYQSVRNLKQCLKTTHQSLKHLINQKATQTQCYMTAGFQKLANRPTWHT